VLLVVVSPPQEASARGSIYSYTDARGVVHFTNVRKDDPRYQRISAPRAVKRFRAPRRSDYDPLIDEVARAHSVPPALVKAVIAAESAFDPGAISRAGAQGLMQLMPATADQLGVMDPAVDKYGGIPPYRETQAYVARVLTYYRSYHGDFAR
jgi:soluble lytic murein transglycosylase-like protein